MKTLFVISMSLMLSVTAFAAYEHKQSGRAKAFKGTEGEILTLIPLDNDTKMLVETQNMYGVNDGKALVYDYRDDQSPQVTFPNPRDPKGHSWQVVVYGKDGERIYTDKLEPKLMGRVREIKCHYSDELSAKVDAKKLMKQATDFVPPTDAD